MAASTAPKRLQSWIPPDFAWTVSPDVFCIDVPLSDPDVIEFVSTGVLEVTVYGTKVIARLTARIRSGDGLKLRGQLEQAVWSQAKLKPTSVRIKGSTKVVAYCHGVFLLPDRKNLCVVVGRSKPVAPSAWISSVLKAEADAMLAAHRLKVAEFDESIRLKKQDNDDFYTRHNDLKKFEGLANAQVAMESFYQRPVVTAEPLLQLLPHAVTFGVQSSSPPEKVARSAVAAIAGSGCLPSRDGTYSGILTGAQGRNAQVIVTWEPHLGPPSYPEIRWAAQRRLPSAFASPRSEVPGRPEFEHQVQSSGDSAQVELGSPGAWDFAEAFDGMEIFPFDFQERVKESRKDRKTHGFEAIAWYQPYHVWTEETWGIYFDAKKLDDLACSLIDDFKTNRVHGGSHSLAALLAFGLVYAHELFHAKVEAALSWQEINALQPRHQRYNKNVYQALRETPEWLEEALANWSAWDWFKTQDIQAVINRMSSNADCLDRVVEASLDLSPPGYQEWRLGRQPGTWRAFANQLSSGKPKISPPGIGMPIESVLTGPLSYDFLATDIPVRFAGQGIIADRLQSHPATFNVPQRREMERALRHFRHSLDASGGKGGHQKWTGPDHRAFILPTRDPVSPGVFKTFLHHVGIDKATYVRQVRPNL